MFHVYGTRKSSTEAFLSVIARNTESPYNLVGSKTYDQMSVKIRKFGETSWTALTLTAPDWVEVGLGLYLLRLSDTNLDTIGDFDFIVESYTGGDIIPFFGNFQVAAAGDHQLWGEIATARANTDNLIQAAFGRDKIISGSGVRTVYESDGTTPLATFQCKDSLGANSGTEVFERVPLTGPGAP